jgi:hypothetical protein
VTSDISEIVRFLVEMLGRSLVAYITDSEVRTVARWAKGQNVPLPVTEQRLRDLYNIVGMLQGSDSAYVVRAWMIGMNPQLDDEAPADVIREGRVRDALAAARAYVNGG